MAITVERLSIPEILRITPATLRDDRGFFLESYRWTAFQALGVPPFLQDNHSRSARGVLRGLHYQLSASAQGKLVRVVAGAAFDVAVDLRRASRTFGQWVSATLSAENQQMLYIPPGFAHGFLALAEGTELLYKTTAEYAPADERGIRWDDPDLGIRWPVSAPILSARDGALPALRDADNDF